MTTIPAGASSNRFELSRIKETTWGVTPGTPNMTKTRLTNEALEHQKQTAQSQELRSDRQISDLAEVGAEAGGPINIELSFGAYDDLLAGLLGNAWADVTFNGSVTFASGTPDTMTATGIETNFEVGDHVRVRQSGGGANDGWHEIIGLATDTIQVKAGSLTAGGPFTCDLDTSRLKIGSTPDSFTLEKHFTDLAPATLGKYIAHTGAMPSLFSIAAQARRIVTGQVGFVAKDTEVRTTAVASAYTAAPTNPVMNATSGIGGIYVDNTLLTTGLLGVNFSINGNLTTQPEIGNKFPFGVNQGSFAITGDVDAYFADGTLFKKAVDHEGTGLWLPFHDAPNDKVNGNSLLFTFPYFKFSTGSPQAVGLNRPVQTRLNFQSIIDPTTLATVRIERYAAT